MWLMLFFALLAQAAPSLDFDVFKEKIQPLLAEKRPGHARGPSSVFRSVRLPVL